MSQGKAVLTEEVVFSTSTAFHWIVDVRENAAAIDVDEFSMI
ncbi:MAG: hypothetical protein AB4042_08945 [Leptolyngbyaceae cyanobacterium]